MGSILRPALISRDAELRTLTAALDEAVDGRGSMLVLAGDPGVGKSRLAAEASSLAASRGFHVFCGRAVQSADPVPFRPVIEALMRIARTGGVPDSPEIADYLPALATLVPEWGNPGADQAEISPLILGEAVLRLLTLPGRACSLLVLEDLHWADPETLAIVEYCADNLASRHVMILASLRDSEPSAGLDLFRSIHAKRAAAMLDLPRLTEPEVGQMAAACLGTDEVPGAVTLGLLANCDGLPFAIEEILAAAVASGRLVRRAAGWQVDEDVEASVPASIVGSVRNRLAALGTGVTNVVVTAAVLGRQFDWTLLPGVAGVAAQDVLTALQRARDVQLIEPTGTCPRDFRFRHSLTRDAIISDLLPPDLVRLSASAAAAIRDAHPGLPGTWCEQAAELHAAAGQPAQAASLLIESARRARRKGALSSATALLWHARELLGTEAQAEPELVIELDGELAKVYALAGDNAALGPLAEHLSADMDASGTDPSQQALIRIRIARAMSGERPDVAAAHLSAARAIAAGLRDPALACQADAVAARCAIDAGDLPMADELAHRALAAAEAAGLRDWAAVAGFEALAVIGRRERVRDLSAAQAAFERAHHVAVNAGFAIRRIEALHELGTIEMLRDGGSTRLCEARELAQQAGAISTAMIIELQLANVWCLGTDLDRAMATAVHCEQAAGRIKAQRVQALATTAQAFILGIRGERRAAKLATERAEGLLPNDPEVLFSTRGQAIVVSSLFLDDASRALRESDFAMSHSERVPPGPRRAWALHALLRANAGDDGRGAIRRARAAGADVGWNRGWLAYAEAVLEGRAGHPDLATALAEAAQVHFQPFAPWWNPLARRVIAEAALRDGWGQPVPWMREANCEFQASGHDRLASACRGILRRAGERVPRSGRGSAHVPAQMRKIGVTSREMDVFLLVAGGLSNVEIGARLFISPKTVETHVASLVAKTGQNCRRRLVAHAAHFSRG